MHTALQPASWTKPVGYANGIAARGRLIFISGQIGWNGQGEFETDDLVEQVRQTLANIVEILREAGAEPKHLTSMTWYLIDKGEYLAQRTEIGKAYRMTIGKHFPSMAVVQVAGLLEPRAKVEIQAIATVPE